MATKERVLAYIEECEVRQTFTLMTQGFATQMAERFADKGNELGQECALDQAALYEHIQDLIMAKVADMYGALYTDEELDQLTEVFHLPISRRSRELMPAIQQRTVEIMLGLEGEILKFTLKREFGKLVDEAIA